MKMLTLSRNCLPATKRSTPARAAFALLSPLSLFALAALTLVSTPARAVDGCQVLLCLAAPSWRSIPQCVPTVTRVLRDLARGKPFPSCAMSGAGNSADHDWASAPSFCPVQYTRIHERPNGPVYSCDYAGAISVTVNGTRFARTWWSMDGTTSTEFSPGAKSQLRDWDTRFDEDYGAWLRSQPPFIDPVVPSY